MALEDWDKQPNGNIRTCPLLGWDIATLPMTGLVRFQYVESEQDLLQMSGRFLPVGMTAAQARALSEDLLRMAQHIEQQPLGTKQ